MSGERSMLDCGQHAHWRRPHLPGSSIREECGLFPGHEWFCESELSVCNLSVWLYEPCHEDNVQVHSASTGPLHRLEQQPHHRYWGQHLSQSNAQGVYVAE